MFSAMLRLSILFCLLLCFAMEAPVTLAAEPRWDVSGALRVRGEVLADSFRLLAPQRDELLLTRLEMGVKYRGERLQGQLEVQDSRAFNDRALSPIGTDDVNALEPIQAWLGTGWQLEEGTLQARVGRMTLDYGSRRLLARNNFRNSSNAFQGGLLRWERGATQLQGFFLLPLQRQPGALQREALRENRMQLDRAGSAERLGGFTASWESAAGAAYEAYLFDSRRRARRLRPVGEHDLLTLGGRLRLQRGPWRGEGELAVQWGESRPVPVPSVPWQTHRAWTVHASVARQLGNALELRLIYDQASGDDDPTDNRNERFDRLYGARAFELGPSGIFGLAVRSNLRSVALRLQAQPHEDHRILLSLRQLSLDSPRDALIGSGRRDFSGASGRDIGQQWELRWRWTLSPLELEAGLALLDPGSYFKGAGAPLNPPLEASLSRYAFTQMTWRF
jgi:hypothetical protein